MADGKLRCYTRIQIVVEVVGSPYGPEWKIGDIEKQAREESVQGLKNKLQGMNITVIGNPKVVTHFMREEE